MSHNDNSKEFWLFESGLKPGVQMCITPLQNNDCKDDQKTKFIKIGAVPEAFANDLGTECSTEWLLDVDNEANSGLLESGISIDADEEGECEVFKKAEKTWGKTCDAAPDMDLQCWMGTNWATTPTKTMCMSLTENKGTFCCHGKKGEKCEPDMCADSCDCGFGQRGMARVWVPGCVGINCNADGLNIECAWCVLDLDLCHNERPGDALSHTCSKTVDARTADEARLNQKIECKATHCNLPGEPHRDCPWSTSMTLI